MTLLETVVLLHEVQIISSDNDCSLHFHLDDNTTKNATSNIDIAGKGTLFVDVGAFHRFTGSFESQSNVLVITDMASGVAFRCASLAIHKNRRLLLESLFLLVCHG